jgi:hypothetical protein
MTPVAGLLSKYALGATAFYVVCNDSEFPIVRTAIGAAR